MYQTAYQQESQVCVFKRDADERGTPFIEIDNTITDFVQHHTDNCVQQMFQRSVKHDGELTAIFPFQRLASNFIITSNPFGTSQAFDGGRERRENQKVRALLHTLKAGLDAHVDENNPSAARKAQHYRRALDEQLRICDDTDAFLNDYGSMPFPGEL